jgi:hypothetical protein
MVKKFFIIKAFLVSLIVSISFCFFSGIFWNSSKPYKAEFNQNHWYYLNRGIPKIWSGVSKSNSSVNLPLVKAPFLESNLEGEKYNKIIDLSVFIPLVLIVILLVYPFSFIIVKASEENKDLNFFIIPAYVFLGLLLVFLYYFWFPRI